MAWLTQTGSERVMYLGTLLYEVNTLKVYKMLTYKMRYGDLYKTVKVSENLIIKTLDCINFSSLEDDTAKDQMYNNISEQKKLKSRTKTIRNNKVTFINNQNILSQFLNLSKK